MHRWKFSALATAAILSAGLLGTDANALTLGRVNVQSALGEPLRAEIELPQITAAEAESLRVSTANAAAFRSQGLEYSPTVGNVQVQVHRRADGSMVLRLSSSRPINEPFVDLVLDATWKLGPYRAQLHHAVRPTGTGRQTRRSDSGTTAGRATQRKRAGAPPYILGAARRAPGGGTGSSRPAARSSGGAGPQPCSCRDRGRRRQRRHRDGAPGRYGRTHCQCP